MSFHSRARGGAIEINVHGFPERSLGVPIVGRNFNEIVVRHDQQDKIFWCFMNQSGRPSYTYSLGAEIQQVQDWVADNYALPANGGPDDLRYFVCGSKTPAVICAILPNVFAPVTSAQCENMRKPACACNM